jgi:BlaI family penicillinase repressor
MSRPKSSYPTPGELEVLRILWDRGPSTVRQVLEVVNRKRKRHYTSVMSLLNTMAEKGLVTSEAAGRAFVYRARVGREKTLGRLVKDLLGRAFEGSAGALVLQVLDQCSPSPEEMDQIAEAIERYRKSQGAK